MRTSSTLVGLIFAFLGAQAHEIAPPIDSEVKASTVAATEYFHPQACVSNSFFQTVLEEFEAYWAVTVKDDGQDGTETCSRMTVYVCKLSAKVVLDEPEIACSE